MKLYDVIVGIVILAAAIATGYSLFGHDVEETYRYLILVGWLIVPPIHFFMEYYLKEADLQANKAAFDRFKDLQRLAAAIWAGIAAALAIVYFK